MAAFGSPLPVIVDSRPEPMSQAMQEKLRRTYAPGSLITFNAIISSKPSEPFEVYARVVEEVGESLHVVICNEQNEYCTNFSNGIIGVTLPKRNVVCLKRTMFADNTCASPAAGGAKKKSRRNKPRKTKRKSRRPKRTRKRRA